MPQNGRDLVCINEISVYNTTPQNGRDLVCINEVTVYNTTPQNGRDLVFIYGNSFVKTTSLYIIKRHKMDEISFTYTRSRLYKRDLGI